MFGYNTNFSGLANKEMYTDEWLLVRRINFQILELSDLVIVLKISTHEGNIPVTIACNQFRMTSPKEDSFD